MFCLMKHLHAWPRLLSSRDNNSYRLHNNYYCAIYSCVCTIIRDYKASVHVMNLLVQPLLWKSIILPSYDGTAVENLTESEMLRKDVCLFSLLLSHLFLSCYGECVVVDDCSDDQSPLAIGGLVYSKCIRRAVLQYSSVLCIYNFHYL